MKKAEEVFKMVHEKVETRKKLSIEKLRKRLYDSIDSMDSYDFELKLNDDEYYLVGDLSAELREYGFRLSLEKTNDGNYLLISIAHYLKGENK